MVALPGAGLGAGMGFDANGNYTQQMPQQQPRQFSPVYPQQQMGTGNPAMDSLQSQLQGRQDFLNQAKMQDVNRQWQSTLASQNGFGTRYQQGRLQGQQLFNDILAPMMAGPGAGGAQGAYEFIKDTNKRIDDGMAQQTNERLKTTQALSNLADIAHKADAGTFAKMGQTIALHKAAAEINDRLSMKQWHDAQGQKAAADASVAQQTIGDKVKEAGAKSATAVQKSHQAVSDTVTAYNKKLESYYQMVNEYQKYKQSTALAPSQQEKSKADAMKATLAAEGERLENERKRIQARNDEQKGNNEQIAAQSSAAESGSRTALNKEKLKTQGYKTAYTRNQADAAGNKAAGIDKAYQQGVANDIEGAKKRGWTDAQILDAVRKKEKDANKVKAYELYLQPNTSDEEAEPAPVVED